MQKNLLQSATINWYYKLLKFNNSKFDFIFIYILNKYFSHLLKFYFVYAFSKKYYKILVIRFFIFCFIVKNINKANSNIFIWFNLK